MTHFLSNEPFWSILVAGLVELREFLAWNIKDSNGDSMPVPSLEDLEAAFVDPAQSATHLQVDLGCIKRLREAHSCTGTATGVSTDWKSKTAVAVLTRRHAQQAACTRIYGLHLCNKWAIVGHRDVHQLTSFHCVS